MTRKGLVAAAFAAAGLCAAAPAGGPVIETGDVARFYRLYDATGGHPTAAQLQQYLDQGSPGLHTLAKARNVTGASIAAAMARDPALYADAKRCMAVLPQVRTRVAAALRKLGRLYPEAKFPPVTIAVGRGKPVAIGGPGGDGVQIGLEALCGVKYFDADVEDRFVHVISHEYIHVQQSQALADDDHPTVLEISLIEGAAEFMAEKISGAVANPGVWAEARGHETAIETAFVPDEDSRDLSKWVFNGTMEKPGDLGYWVGYRIVKAYYQHAADKRRAIADILQMTDPKAFLARSGWYPGIRLH